ncbi:ROK family glucokinase [Alicyclobacillus fastidiosus]|uniref:Glucokinase n=1 Tax=Alicyclobacillus fastidiosus TaxID=392011 RepID=A0ABY6ZLY1_9BACL|nr:ROK family glucokinase [Alicyclobacillus fastidiosus]WAH43862.1 ROK family glucokinase [Alicyclobacillus fastidiosus]GMA60100.1 glucokinase [Alicyclobacillus fastidiosus]
MTLYFGVDVGGTSIKTALVTATGQIIVKQAFATQSESSVEHICLKLRGVLKESLQQTKHKLADVAGVGVGLPGFLDLRNGIILKLPNIGWENIPFIDIAEDVFGLPVVMENDAKVAALAESWTGAGRNALVLVCVTVGTGVGGGFVLHRHLYRGVNGMAGEVGHLTVDRNGLACHCGRRGCLETVASATAMIRRAKELQQAGQMPSQVAIDDAKTIFDLAAQGDEAAQQVVRETADWLGYGLSMIAGTINPDTILIGGGVSTAGDAFLKPVTDAFRRYALDLVSQAATIAPAQLGNDAGVIGASRLVSTRESLRR